MVTRDDQLKWLAENSGSFTGEYVVMSMHHIGRAIEQGDNFPPKPPFGVYFFTRQEWMNEKDRMQKIATIDNSWHERGELPPASLPVELWVCGTFAYNCELIAKRGNNYVLWNLDSDKADSADYMHSQFRPLRTERDKAIEEMANLIAKSVFGSAKCQAEKLYDAGYRKQQGGDE